MNINKHKQTSNKQKGYKSPTKKIENPNFLLYE